MDPKELKTIINRVFANFITEEGGNKVTSFNMSGLMQLVFLAVEGKVSLEKLPAPEAPVETTQIMD